MFDPELQKHHKCVFSRLQDADERVMPYFKCENLKFVAAMRNGGFGDCCYCQDKPSFVHKCPVDVS